MKNIIFLLDVEKKPSGGRKILYQFSNYINTIKKDFRSYVCFVEKKKTLKLINSIKKRILFKRTKIGWNFNDLKISKKIKIKWSYEKLNFKKNLEFNKYNDFVILPEIFAHFGPEFLVKQKIPYAIFVQNGYAIFPISEYKKLKLAYKNAKFILSYSKDIDKCISNAFPEYKNKILKVTPGINANKLIPALKKNIITYMPRKLSKHSELVLSFLHKHLPKNWKIKALDNLPENKVFENLRKSKIFMSFSELEGLGLPPIEAAIAGNKVVGYNGTAGREYWKLPIFTEINNGEILKFYKNILKNLENKNFLTQTKAQRNYLIKRYSFKKQNESINKFLKKIK